MLDDGGTLVACAGEHSAVLRFDAAGRRVGVLAPMGDAEGQVEDPSDLVVERGSEELRARVAVIDRSGDRLQVFSLSGAYFGSVQGLLEEHPAETERAEATSSEQPEG